jgi:hypothetical protein
LLEKIRKLERMNDKDWKEIDEKDSSEIHLNLDEGHSRHHRRQTMKDIWKKLEGFYMEII